jgi:hypothetical protein
VSQLSRGGGYPVGHLFGIARGGKPEVNNFYGFSSQVIEAEIMRQL